MAGGNFVERAHAFARAQLGLPEEPNFARRPVITTGREFTRAGQSFLPGAGAPTSAWVHGIQRELTMRWGERGVMDEILFGESA